MNIRLQNYKKNRLAGMNQYESAVEAGYSQAYAKGKGRLIEEKSKIALALDRNGLTDEKLVKKHAELLESTKVVGYLHDYKKSENGGIEKIEPDEVISSEFVEVPDRQVQTKNLELAYKLKGHLKDKVLHSGHVGGGEARIYIINGVKEKNGRSISNAQRLPEKISI